MRCVKCGYVSFDHLSECRKCGVDISAARELLGFSSSKPSAPSALAQLLRDHEPPARTESASPEPEISTSFDFGDEEFGGGLGQSAEKTAEAAQQGVPDPDEGDEDFSLLDLSDDELELLIDRDPSAKDQSGAILLGDGPETGAVEPSRDKGRPVKGEFDQLDETGFSSPEQSAKSIAAPAAGISREEAKEDDGGLDLFGDDQADFTAGPTDEEILETVRKKLAKSEAALRDAVGSETVEPSLNFDSTTVHPEPFEPAPQNYEAPGQNEPSSFESGRKDEEHLVVAPGDEIEFKLDEGGIDLKLDTDEINLKLDSEEETLKPAAPSARGRLESPPEAAGAGGAGPAIGSEDPAENPDEAMDDFIIELSENDLDDLLDELEKTRKTNPDKE